MRAPQTSAHIKGMTTDTRASAITAADPTLAEHAELLDRFLAAAQTAGLISAAAPQGQGLNREELVALLDGFDDIELKVSVDGWIGSPGLHRFGTSDDCITAHFYRVPEYRVNVREFSDQLSAITELFTQFGSILIANTGTPVLFTDTDSKHPGWWIVTGAEEREGCVQLILKAESRA